MRVDVGNCLASVATPGVPRAALDRLDERVAAAHERIADGIAQETFGYTALALPDRVRLDRIRRAVAPLEGLDTLLVIGIGGSALGAATLTAALGEDTRVHILDNVDPEHVRVLLADCDLSTTGMHVVSRSGTTAETLANFLVARAAFERAGVDWTDRTIVTTGPEGNLRSLAETHDLPVLDAPPGVPGRFSVFSPVALPAAAVAGVDLDGLIAGAAAERERLAGSLFECPAYAYAAATHALNQRGVSVNAVMPYGEALERFAEWVGQLWAESLGKDGLGQTPARAMGATDQHSQLQLYRAGPRTTVVSFIRPRERPDVSIPSADMDDLAYLEGQSLGALLDAEFRATEASLAAADRPSLRVEIDRLDARGLGRLLYGFEAATVMAGELAGVETFTQPAVEWAKEATRDLLRDESSTSGAGFDETDELVVE
ncbi:MAG: glucose-6-phosphate isomerase [Halobacteriaceae archaeon]